MARKPGLVTSGEIEAVRLVGPMAPATKRGRPSSASRDRGGRAREPGAFAVELVRDGRTCRSRPARSRSRRTCWSRRCRRRRGNRRDECRASRRAASGSADRCCRAPRGSRHRSARRDSRSSSSLSSWIIVPMAPSSTRMRSAARRRSRCSVGDGDSNLDSESRHWTALSSHLACGARELAVIGAARLGLLGRRPSRWQTA